VTLPRSAAVALPELPPVVKVFVDVARVSTSAVIAVTVAAAVAVTVNCSTDGGTSASSSGTEMHTAVLCMLLCLLVHAGMSWSSLCTTYNTAHYFKRSRELITMWPYTCVKRIGTNTAIQKHHCTCTTHQVYCQLLRLCLTPRSTAEGPPESPSVLLLTGESRLTVVSVAVGQ
jgi:hypothetical protein